MEFPNLASSVKRMSLEEVVLTISVIGNVFLMPITFVITFVQRRSFFSGKRMTQIKCFHSSLSLCCSFAAIHILIWINLRREYAEYTYELLFLYPYFVIMGGVFFFLGFETISSSIPLRVLFYLSTANAFFLPCFSEGSTMRHLCLCPFEVGLPRAPPAQRLRHP